MLGRLYTDQDCSAARALELVGERWSLLILRDAIFRRYTRFSDFQRSLGVASNVLAKRLDSFVAAGLMDIDTEAGGHPDYRLTEKGHALAPVIVALTEWGDRWVGPGPVLFDHAACGGRVRSGLTCDRCGQAVADAEVRASRRT